MFVQGELGNSMEDKSGREYLKEHQLRLESKLIDLF